MFSTSPLKIRTEPIKSPDERFPVAHRQELIDGFEQAKLTNARVILIGAGGVGGEMGEGLCHKGVGGLSLFDHDVVEYTNLNRQHFFNKDIGKPKAHCLARNLALHCHAGTTLEGYPYSFQDAEVLNIDLSGSVVVCGVDNSEARVAVSKYYLWRRTPVVFIAVDLLAECGHVFVQESTATSPCFGCAFPNSLAPRHTPCFVPASKDILKVTAGLGLYAIDSGPDAPETQLEFPTYPPRGIRARRREHHRAEPELPILFSRTTRLPGCGHTTPGFNGE